MASHLGASRLLYGMGRSQALPESFFGAVDPKNHIPRNNVLLIGAVVLVASLFLSYGFLIELVNFGALTAYLGVNAAAFMRYFVRGAQKTVLSFVLPIIGFLVCLLLLWGLSVTAKLVGLAWSALGFTYVLWRTRWFRRPLWVEGPTVDRV
jgi:putrescine importer